TNRHAPSSKCLTLACASLRFYFFAGLAPNAQRPSGLMNEPIEEILKFWFGETPAEEGFAVGSELWFRRSARIDRYIERKFGKLIDKAKSGQLDAWRSTPRGRLALILILDQFTRNVFR